MASTDCAICGNPARPGRRTCRQSCAGVLSRRQRYLRLSQEAAQKARDRYDNEGKTKARAVPMRWLVERVPQGGRYLGLYGGGSDAELAVGLRPDVEVVSADNDPALRLALLEHAERIGFIAVPGDFRRAPGLYDLIYLDLCGNASEKTMRQVRDAAKMLTPSGALVVTITPDHESDPAVSVSRAATIGPLLVARSKMALVGLLIYRNKDGKRVTVGVLHGPARKLDVVDLHDRVQARGRWSPYGKSVAYGRLLFQNSLLSPSRAERHRNRMAADPAYAELRRRKAREANRKPERVAYNAAYQRAYRESHREAINERTRRWRQARRQGPFTRSCATCSATYTTKAWNAKYCSEACSPRQERSALNAASRRYRANHLDDLRAKDREYRRVRRARLAAVSGTAAEAVKSG